MSVLSEDVRGVRTAIFCSLLSLIIEVWLKIANSLKDLNNWVEKYQY
jgi:hypothetical protein